MSAGAGAQRPIMYTDASIYAAEDPFATAMLVENGQIAWMGSEQAARAVINSSMDQVSLDGALIAPAFVDSHLHLTEYGQSILGLDLAATRRARDVLDAVAHAAAGMGPDEAILGTGWDESEWDDPAFPTPAELGRAAGGRQVYLSRRDMHTALASDSLLDRAGVPQDTTPLTLGEEAHGLLRAAAIELSDADRRRSQSTALKTLAARGYAAVAEMAAPWFAGRRDMEILLELTAGEDAGGLPTVYPYWGELVETPEQASAVLEAFGHRLSGLGGDLSADGSIGARTAWLSQPYADDPSTRGESSLSVEEMCLHVAACSQAGVQAAFHAIGDQAVTDVLSAVSKAAERLGVREVQRCHHRIEHVEMISEPGMQSLLDLGMIASVQPRFDEHWGAEQGMYEARLGAERARRLNPWGDLSARGIPLALGSDAPVTDPDPWADIAACMNHHDAAQALPARAAFLAHTRSGYRAAGEPNFLAGTLRWGSPATFAIWEPSELEVASRDFSTASFSMDARGRTPMLPSLDAKPPACLRTVRDGVTLYDAGALPGA